MRRFRLSTLLLLIVIAALVLALIVQQRRAAERERKIAELQARVELMLSIEARNARLIQDLGKRKAQTDSDRDPQAR